MEVTILGCGSATPSARHLPSSQVVSHNGALFMIDCGECAQLSFRKRGFSFGRLRHIFISHLHGDHVLGLVGLLSTLSLHEITGQVHVYMVPDGIPLMRQMVEAFAHELTYELVFHPLAVGKAVVYEDKTLQVETFALCHRVPAVGFIFREKPKPRRLLSEMLEHYEVPLRVRPSLKDGADYVREDGTVVPNAWLTADPEPSLSYAYCSDTIYNPGVVEAVKGVTLLYHEATYGDDKADKAAMRGHSTARQAGKAAAQAGAGQLLIGHYSQAYAGAEEILLRQAREEFPNTILANEGLTVKVKA